MVDLPYFLNNGKIPEILERIGSAARPERFSQDFLERLGYASSNDRAFIPLLRRLGFIDDSGTPKPIYDDLRDSSKRPFVLGQQVRDLYAELFAINTAINSAGDAEIKSAVARVTGKDEAAANRIANTFKSLVQQSRFDAPQAPQPKKTEEPVPVTPVNPAASTPKNERRGPDFHYNIQIVLPATTEVSVYNAIFKSLKDNLDI